MKSYSYSSLLKVVSALITVSGAMALSSSCTSSPSPSAPPGCGTFTDCSGAGDCRDLMNDNANCGTCNYACSPGTTCAGGTCACSGGLTDCGAGCISTMEDPANCGGCGIVCGVDAPFCSQGVCSATCALTACGQFCVDTNASITNCGGCGVACGAGQLCTAGACTCTTAGQMDCGAGCVDILTNSQNCGGCGIVCQPGQTCGGGACQGGAGPIGVGGATSSTTNGGVGGGTGVGGSTTTGGGDLPPGYWTYADWGGCVWTGIDTVAGSSTSNTPQDFLTQTAGEPYCVSGTVGPDPNYETVALLGFNLAEPAAGADCSYDPAASTGKGPPEVTLTGNGIALNFDKTDAGTNLRIQVQGEDGATDENDRWCAPIDGVGGKVFVPWSDFNTACWDNSGTAFDPNVNGVSAVVFLVPGDTASQPFSYCINGFATGSTAEDAPDGGTGVINLMGEIGGPGSEDLDFERVKVQVDGEQYIIQNNNWGTPGGSDQTIAYNNNSFTVLSSTGGPAGGGAPASFPSIYIGANGDVQGNTYRTSATDELPKQLSSIGSVMSTFRWSGGQGGGEYNVTYDIWFSDVVPEPGSYDDGLDGFVMVWLYDPPSYQPIGGSPTTTASIAGATWDVWVGPRGGGGPNNNAPVVSYVISGGGPKQDLSNQDLMAFIDDAEKHGISQAWYLTDVFAGFEIWQGSHGQGLKVEEFTAVVQ